MKELQFKDLTEYCQALAVAGKLSPDEESVWRYFCRVYSQKFNTPLVQVLEMEPEHVILNVYESQMDDLDTDENLDRMLDIIYGLEDPEYEASKKEELNSFIEQAEKEEKERLSKNKPIHPALRYESEVSLKNTPENEAATKEAPKSGGINLAYLAKEEE